MFGTRIVKTPGEHVQASRHHKDLISRIFNVLKPLDIDFFAYMRAYKGMKTPTAIGLYSDANSMQTILEKGVQSPFLDEKGSILAEGYYFSNDLNELLKSKRCINSYENSLEKLQEIQETEKATWDGAFFIVKQNQLYDEVFYFSSSHIEKEIHKVFFLNHSQLINEFCLFFLSEAQEAISDANLCAIEYPILNSPSSKGFFDQRISNDLDQQVRKAMSLKKFRFVVEEKEVFLTEREFTCLKHVVKGAKPKEVAPSLSISVKGYESIVQRIKEKFAVSNKESLIEIYSNSIYSSPK